MGIRIGSESRKDFKHPADPSNVMRAVPLFAVLIVAFAGLAGCVESDDQIEEADETSETTTSETGAGNETEAPKPPVANLTVSVDNLTLSYDVADDANATGVNGTLDFGDGNSTALANIPATGSYDYSEAGEYTVILTLQNGAGSSNDSESINITVAGPPAPDVPREFKSGPVLGCISDGPLGHEGCPAFAAGPEESEFLGLWIPIQPGHIGLQYEALSDSALGDTDSYQLDADMGLVEENANGADPGTGIILPTTAWVLVISYGEPALEIVATFTDPPAE